METRELLELAAKACGLKYSDDYEERAGLWIVSGGQFCGRFWNPLTSDGDCAWMEAELRIDLDWDGPCVTAISDKGIPAGGVVELISDHPSPGHARRMASTRVAAEIQRQREAQG